MSDSTVNTTEKRASETSGGRHCADAEDRIADCVLRCDKGTSSANVLAQLYLGLKFGLSFRVADVMSALDPEKQGWAREVLSAYGRGIFTGRHAEAIGESYHHLLERMRAADDAVREAAERSLTSVSGVDEEEGQVDLIPIGPGEFVGDLWYGRKIFVTEDERIWERSKPEDKA